MIATGVMVIMVLDVVGTLTIVSNVFFQNKLHLHVYYKTHH